MRFPIYNRLFNSIEKKESEKQESKSDEDSDYLREKKEIEHKK